MFNQHCHATTTTKAHLRVAERGAAFVEAVVAIPVLTLGLMGLIFFRELYTSQIAVSRLARAGTLAHSMAACVGASPKEWLGRDLAQYRISAPGRSQSYLDLSSTNSSSTGLVSNGHANKSLANSGRSDGTGILNQVAETEVSSRVGVNTDAQGFTGSQGNVFTADVVARSYVSCGEEVRTGDYTEVVDYIQDEAKTLLPGCL